MSTKQSIQEGNQLIREFMDHGFLSAKLYYDAFWNDLVPVVEKIESISTEQDGYFGVHISSNSCTIQGTKLRTDRENFHAAYFDEVYDETKLMATWRAVVRFIKWYNQQNKS